MKKTILSLTIAVVTAFAAKAQTPSPTGTTDNPNAPEITFETEVIDYGTIDYNSTGDREFKFKNTGKEPLIIQSATGSCGCTVPTAPKDPIPPGGTSVIKVHYDTKRVGSFEKTVTIVSNGKTPTKQLKIKGTVKPDPNTTQNTNTVQPK